MTAADKIQTRDLRATEDRAATRDKDRKVVARDRDHKAAARVETRADRVTGRRDQDHKVAVRDRGTRVADKVETRAEIKVATKVADNNNVRQDRAITGRKVRDVRREARVHATRGRVHRNRQVHRKRIKIEFYNDRLVSFSYQAILF